MLVVEVDGVHAQPPQAALTRLSNVFRLTADTAGTWILGITHDTELGREHNPVAFAFDGAPYQLFVDVRTVNI